MVLANLLEEIADECLKHVKADTARICKPLEKMYLIIGFYRNTRDNVRMQIEHNGRRVDFEYVEEHVVASGITQEELVESVKEYQQLCEIGMDEYLRKAIL